jgi:hypothetical protein
VLYQSIARTELILRLTAPRRDEVLHVETIARAIHGDILWVVNRISARQGTQWLKAGQSLCVIVCFLLCSKDNEWGYREWEESENPAFHSCPLHFLDMAPEQRPEWRQKVREYYNRRPSANTGIPSLAA